MDLPIHYENLRKQINQETVKDFWKNGYAVFHEIYDANTLKVMKDEMANIIDNFSLEDEEVEDFETKNNNRANYFMDSAW